MRRLVMGSVVGLALLLPNWGQAQNFDQARQAIKVETYRGDGTGSIRGGINLHTGERNRNLTLWRSQANVGGTCSAFDFRASMKEAFKEFPELVEFLFEAVKAELPILVTCALEPVLCDVAKDAKAFLNAVVQAKYGQCQAIQNAMAYAGLRIHGGQVSQCLEDAVNDGLTLQEAMHECNRGGSPFRLPNGTKGREANLVKDTLIAAGASQETITLAGALVGDITLQSGEGRLRINTTKPRAAMQARYESHKTQYEMDMRAAIQEYQETGTLQDTTIQGLAIPGQPMPEVVVEALARQGDPIRREALLGKITTRQALARLTYDCQDLENQIRDAVAQNQHLTDEARRQMEEKYRTLQRNLAQMAEQVMVAENLQPAMDEALRQYTALQQVAVDAGLQAGSLTLAHGRFTRQAPLGYRQ